MDDERLLDVIVGLNTLQLGIEQLDILRIPWRLDGDPTDWDHGPGMFSPGSPPRFVLWTSDTRYWSFDPTAGEQELAEFAAISRRVEEETRQFKLRHAFLHEGQPMTVMTDFCSGTDFNLDHPGHPPLIFETAIWDRDGQPYGRCWKYATARAARFGHAQIVAALS